MSSEQLIYYTICECLAYAQNWRVASLINTQRQKNKIDETTKLKQKTHEIRNLRKRTEIGKK